MKSKLLETAQTFVNGKSRYNFVVFCNNGLKMAEFERKFNSNYMTLSIKEFNPITNMFNCVQSTGSTFAGDIIETIKQELNLQPIKPIVFFRANQRIKKH